MRLLGTNTGASMTVNSGGTIDGAHMASSPANRPAMVILPMDKKMVTCHPLAITDRQLSIYASKSAKTVANSTPRSKIPLRITVRNRFLSPAVFN